MSERALFATKIGVIASTVGSAIGLGNIWRFPYITGQDGGAIFLLTYIVCILLIGIPLMIAEFMIGRKAKSNVSRAFTKLKPGTNWNMVGYIGIAACIIILGFYMVISGWVTEYLIKSFSNDLIGKSSAELTASFEKFVTDPYRPLLGIFIFLFLNYIIIIQGVTKGIERASNILMPLLFVILIVFCIKAMFMPGTKEGLSYLFRPDISKLNTKVVFDALGQAFFSLSIGMGILITYGSYFKRNTNLTSTASIVTFLNLLMAILAGMIIFPATFSFGINPTQGPELIFITLPNVLQKFAHPHLWSVLFFLLVAVAALTSTISLCEVVVAYIHEEFKTTRNKAALILMLIVAVLSILCSLSFGVLKDATIFGRTIFDFSDFVSANILLPTSGFLLAIFVLMLITTAEIAIVLCYFQLASEDYRWWWRSFVNTGCTALFVFAFSLFYMLSHGITKIVSGRRWRCVLNSDFVLVLDDDGVYRSFFGLWNHWILRMFLVYEEDLWFTEGRLPFLFYTCCLFS